MTEWQPCTSKRRREDKSVDGGMITILQRSSLDASSIEKKKMENAGRSLHTAEDESAQAKIKLAI